MVGLNGRVRALLLSASIVSLVLAGSSPVFAQASGPQADTAKPAQAKRKKNTRQSAVQQDAPVLQAYAQIGRPTEQPLDVITVAASKSEERAIDALAPVSVVTLDQIQGRQPSRLSDLFYNLPGVWLQDRGDSPASSINIRGLQDFGRVAVLVDGARQNYQRTGHNANGEFFLNQELIGGIDVVRGPTANIYGSGAIGGVASFRTKDIQDVVRPGERWGVDSNTVFGTNDARALSSVFGGVHVSPNVDFFAGGVYSTQNNYKDGAGTEIGNTGNHVNAGLAKVTVRPADGHEVKLGTVYQEDLYNIGQFNRGPTTTLAPATAIAGTSVYASDVRNYTTTLGWKYSQPDDKLFDWDSKVYWNRTLNDQVKTYNNRITTGAGTCTLSAPGNNISGCVGDARSYSIDTLGFDFHNTSRVDLGNWRNAFTYGIDGFQDDVKTSDSHGNSNVTTPDGQRTVSGAFVQWKANYSSWLEVVSAARYDHYSLSSAAVSSEGSRFSPKITVGLTPVAGITPYVSYAEGYRAPSITETLVAGSHATGGGPPFFNCPDGNSALFCFLPNPNLRPEVGKNKEIGLNLKFDNIAMSGDSFRGKFNVFRNDVDDYIDLIASPLVVPPLFPFTLASEFYQYQNIPQARIQGFEAETMYDQGLWFAGVTATVQSGKNVATGIGLASIQPRKITTTAGLRFLDRKLVISAQWASIAENLDIPAGYVPSTSYDLVNLYVSYNPTPDISLRFSVDNILNQYYRPYAIPGAADASSSQNDLLWTSAGPGIVYKGGLKIHFGGA